ncbi:YmfL family putative regulatory protein [Azotobacter bryophylli]|uniref:YmfL family putative regulatory protein n=1 Tax=Azotobacter bryophylli TaxID=1986537 RepID=A0ABV7AZI5_9GAMM
MSKQLLETRRDVMKAVTRGFPGGQEAAAAHLGIRPKRLGNQVYETAGCSPLSDAQIHALESVNGTRFLPDYVCALYGGVFVKVPEVGELDNVDLYSRVVRAAAKRGIVDQIIAAALEDGVIEACEAEAIREAHYAYLAARHEEVQATIDLHSAQP